MFFSKTFASVALLLAPVVMAVEKRDTTTSINPALVQQCPRAWSLTFLSQVKYCCPGTVQNGADLDNAYCCVRGPNVPTFSSCFPFCSATPGAVSTTTSADVGACATTVMLTDADYSSKVSAAATSIGFTSGAIFTSVSGPGVVSSSSSVVSSDTSTGAAAVMTSGPMAGAMMVAGGLLLAL